MVDSQSSQHVVYGKAAVAEYRQHYTYHRTLETIHRILNKTGSFPWANAECEQQRCLTADVLARVQQGPDTSVQNFQDDWCSTDKGMENCAPWWFLSVSPSNSTKPFTGRLCQHFTILWTARTLATNSAWRSVYRPGLIYWGGCYEYKECAHLDTGRSTPGNTVPF